MKDFRIARPQDMTAIGYELAVHLNEMFEFGEDESTHEASLAEATPGQRAIFTCSWYEYEVSNGGHDQFFYNSTGILWEEALRGLLLIGATEHAEVLQSAAALFHDQRPSKDRQVRYQQLKAIDSEALSNLDGRLYALPELDGFFERYIKDHPEEFFLDG